MKKKTPMTPFHTTRVWRKVRKEVLNYYKNECQECLKEGRYSRATVVHHELPYEHYPELGLVPFLEDGTAQLIPLCFSCHERIETERGNRLVFKEPLTEEWW